MHTDDSNPAAGREGAALAINAPAAGLAESEPVPAAPQALAVRPDPLTVRSKALVVLAVATRADNRRCAMARRWRSALASTARDFRTGTQVVLTRPRLGDGPMR